MDARLSQHRPSAACIQIKLEEMKGCALAPPEVTLFFLLFTRTSMHVANV